MTPLQALNSLLQKDLNYNHVKEEAMLLAVLRRDWAVRVLDAQADLDPDLRMPTDSGRRIRFAIFEGTTRDAARLAAAEAVWPSLPESVRAELGPKP